MTVVERPGRHPPALPRRPRRRRPRNRLRIGLLGVLALAVMVYGVFTKRIPFLHGYRVTAVFESSNQLTPGFSPVRIAGVTVGKVVSVDSGPGATTKVTMELKDSALPLHTDARARIRPRLFLEGGFAVELQPGSPSAPELDDGDTIGLAQTAIPVQFHQILSSFTHPTRDDLRALLTEFDRSLGSGGARALSKTWRPLSPLLRDTAWVGEAARGARPHDASGTIRSTSRITGALASKDAELRGLVSSLARTTTTLAAHDTQVAASIRQIDGLLSDLPPFLDAIDRGVPATKRFVAALRPSLRAAPPVLDHTAGVLDQLGGLVSAKELPQLVRTLGPSVRKLPTLETRLDGLFPLVTPVTDCVRDKAIPVLQAKAPDGSLSSGQPIWADLAHAFVGLAGAGQSFDANGFNVRYLAGAGETSVTTGSLPGLGRLAGLTTAPVTGARPLWLGPGVTPPFRPDVPCADSPVADLSQRAGGGTARNERSSPVTRPRRTLTAGDLRSAIKQYTRGLKRVKP
jgi:phospholipid/cholesterol/gamma-HCH transport system substrate-binding protein